MINQEKTFDRVNHDLLYKIQQKLSFCCNFIYWIGIILTDIKSQIKVNGFLTDKIRVERGIRQGCPMSALLCVLIAKFLDEVKCTKINETKGLFT